MGRLTFLGGRAFWQPWRWITYQYLHAGGNHIFFNMLTLYFFLPALERLWGWKRTLAFYTAGGAFAGVTYGLMCLFLGGRYSSLVGASGSILSILGALAAVAPDMQVLLIVLPITMRTLALLYGVLYTLTVIGDRNVSDAAHLGGLVFGYLLPRTAGTSSRHSNTGSASAASRRSSMPTARNRKRSIASSKKSTAKACTRSRGPNAAR